VTQTQVQFLGLQLEASELGLGAKCEQLALLLACWVLLQCYLWPASLTTINPICVQLKPGYSMTLLAMNGGAVTEMSFSDTVFLTYCLVFH